MIPILLPDDFATSLAVAPVGDGEHFVQAVLHAPTAGTSEIAHVVAYLVSYKTWQVQEIGRSEPLGKDVACAVLLIPGTIATKQTVLLLVTEATPGGAGSTAHENAYVLTDAVPAAIGGASVDTYARATAKAAGEVAKLALDTITEVRGNLRKA